MHDRIAELAGLRTELANCENGTRTGEVQAAIDRVRGELEAQADSLETEAEELTDKGQDVTAAQAAVEARQVRALLAEDAPKKARPAGTSSKRNTSAAKAPEQT